MNNLTNKISIQYDKEDIEFNIDDEIELNKTKFGYDLVENKIDDETFSSKKCLISSNSPIIVTAKYKLNAKGGVTFIATPILVASIIFVALYFSLIKKSKKKEEPVQVESSFNLSEWVDHSVSEDKFKVLTNKEKEVLGYVLKGTPRKE